MDRIKDIDNYIDHIDTNKPLTVITDKDLCVCLEQRVVQVSGIEINFTRQEFDALYLLFSNRKRVMTFKMISIFVWGEEYADVSSKVVSNLISRVRQKLRIEANSQDYIKSIHGIGYKFDP
ncbi:winged helix-turn-helix domain-containing protein [Blautia schinkii]|nr:winged helix-turn-helix domain-containing protein [Blautia schinkii]